MGTNFGTYTLRILHISDLHAAGPRGRAWRWERVLGEAWRRNLDELLEEGPVDLVCFTGDVANWGKAEEYAQAGAFVEELLGHLKLPVDRLFVVPGNHDMDRSVGQEAWEALRQGYDKVPLLALARWMAGGKPPLGFYEGQREDLLSRQAAYREWVAKGLGRPELLPEKSAHGTLGYRASLRPQGWPFDVHLIGLDSAWAAGDDNDAGKLLLTDEQVGALTTTAEGKALPGFRLALMHHPLTDLFDGTHARRLLADNVDLVLRGHLHETAVETLVEPGRTSRQLAAGCLYGSDQWPNACHLIHVELDNEGRPRQYALHFRAWSPLGHWFDSGGRYREARGGRLTWQIASRVQPGDAPARATTLGRLAEILMKRGHQDEVLRGLREEALPVFRRTGDILSLAITFGRIAEILQAQGQWEEALRIRTQEELPVHEKLGDVRARATTLSQIAAILIERGELGDALRILREEVLPVLEGAGDVGARAMALGRVADILRAQGQLDEALRLLREEALPLAEGLGDAWVGATLHGRVADILQARGEPREALRIRLEKELPIHERLDDVRSSTVALERLASNLQRLGALDEALRLRQGRLAERYRQDLAGGAANRQHITDIRRARWDLRPSFLVRSVRIENIKNIPGLSIDFTKPSRLPGHWKCIAGVNGAGKSTVLQVIACTLLGDRLAQEVAGGEVLANMRRRQSIGAEGAKATVHVTMSNGDEEIELMLPLGEQGIDVEELERHPESGLMRAFWEWRARRHLFVSYGAGRNFSERQKAGYEHLSADARRQVTLFDPLARVAHDGLLTQGEAVASPVLAALEHLLTSVLEEGPVMVLPGTLPLRFQVNGATVSAAELPDGFRALITWLADLCATWHDKAPEEARTGDLTKLHGIVLIDEIDLHLHPRLQRSLVPRLRKALPGVQWIVTTHSPLVLSSFDRNELVLLEGSEGGVRELDRDIIGFSTDEIYRWLMRAEPRSGALEEYLRSDDKANKQRLALLLAQSPDSSEEDVMSAHEWRKQLGRKKADDSK